MWARPSSRSSPNKPSMKSLCLLAMYCSRVQASPILRISVNQSVQVQANNAILAHAKQVEIDYTDIASLTKTLNEHNIHTIISAISLYSEAESTAQLNLIKAAKNATPTARFIPSEYSFIQTEALLPLDPSVQYFIDAANLLKTCPTLKSTRVIPGIFMDYWGMPHVKSNLANMTFAVNMANCEAVIPGSGDDVICMTYSYDMAVFIARLLDVDDWEEFSVIFGDEVTYNQLVGIGERVRGSLSVLSPSFRLIFIFSILEVGRVLMRVGRKFKVTYDSLEKIEEGNVTVPTQPEDAGYSKEDMVEATVLTGKLVVGKVFEFPAGGRSNSRFPDLELWNVEDFVRGAWEGKA